MITLITDKNWTEVRASLEAVGDRFAQLVLSVPPTAKATADWTVAQTAAHVVTLSRLDVSLLEQADTALLFPSVADRLPDTTVDTVAELNEAALEDFGERDPRELARQLRSDIDQILRKSADTDPERPITWLGGAQVPLAGLLAHLLNELLIHGRDIARATGSPWEISPRDAALFFEVFLCGMTKNGYGSLLDGSGPTRKGRIAVEFRTRYTTPVAMVMRDGLVSIEEPGDDIDVKLFFDPVTMDLMLFGRISKLRAALTGKVIVSGRRPWLLPAFLRKVRLPS